MSWLAPCRVYVTAQPAHQPRSVSACAGTANRGQRPTILCKTAVWGFTPKCDSHAMCKTLRSHAKLQTYWRHTSVCMCLLMCIQDEYHSLHGSVGQSLPVAIVAPRKTRAKSHMQLQAIHVQQLIVREVQAFVKADH